MKNPCVSEKWYTSALLLNLQKLFCILNYCMCNYRELAYSKIIDSNYVDSEDSNIFFEKLNSDSFDVNNFAYLQKLQITF